MIYCLKTDCEKQKMYIIKPKATTNNTRVIPNNSIKEIKWNQVKYSIYQKSQKCAKIEHRIERENIIKKQTTKV